MAMWIFFVLLDGIICGCISQYINKNKGYEGGFWWGFFLSLIGILVVACKTDARLLQQSQAIVQNSRPTEPRAVNTVQQPQDKWTCPECGETNPGNVAVCASCGAYTWRCGACSHDNEITAQFCINCGGKAIQNWICGECGRKNPTTCETCSQCGKRRKQEWTCRKCSTVNKAEAKFCAKCGGSFQESLILSAGLYAQVEVYRTFGGKELHWAGDAGIWQCSHCRAYNVNMLQRCGSCDWARNELERETIQA